MSNEEPFLSRWSRLKRDGADQQDEATPPAEAEAKPPAVVPAPAPAEEPLDLSKLPRLEDLTPHTDLRAFLDPRVPADLQSAALRRAWRLDPAIDTFIEVAENQYDWNTPGGAPGFGPLVAGSDLPQLLAQATGKLLDAAREPAPSTVATADDTSSTPCPVASPDTALGAAHKAPLELVEPARATALTSMESPDESQPEPAPDTLHRRRHGAALPR